MSVWLEHARIHMGASGTKCSVESIVTGDSGPGRAGQRTWARLLVVVVVTFAGGGIKTFAQQTPPTAVQAPPSGDAACAGISSPVGIGPAARA